MAFRGQTSRNRRGEGPRNFRSLRKKSAGTRSA